MPSNQPDESDAVGHFTLLSLLAATVARRPEAPAITENDLTITWSDLSDAVGSFAAHLAEVGIRHGDRVALWMPNGILYLVAIFAVAARGALAVHLNTRFRALEIGSLIERTRTKALISRFDFEPIDFRQILGDVPKPQLRTLRAVIAPGEGGIVPRMGGVTSVAVAEPHDDCLVFTTGGTTAEPKLVVHRQFSIAGHAAAVCSALAFDRPGAALLAAVPVSGTFGNVPVMAAVAGGAHIVTMPLFNAEEADALIRRHNVTHSNGDDRMIDSLAAEAARAGAPYQTMRFFAAAPFGSDSRPAFERGIGAGLPLHAIYGSSEVQALFAVGQPKDLGFGPTTPLDSTARVAVIDTHLRIAARFVFDRYLDADDKTAKVKQNGWFATGDRARLVGNGFIFEGREDDALRLGGYLVDPGEIETFINGCHGVVQTQVVAVETLAGRRAIAFVIAAPDASIDEAAVIASCRLRMAKYKVPIRVIALSAFPTSDGPNGPKIQRSKLRSIALNHV